MSVPPPTVPSVLLPELIGFIPQFLLDDVINSANEATQQAVDAMEAFLERRDATKQDPADTWKSAEELEKGLNAFQTLLESHVDIAFDFFEAWSLRNIFAIPADLPIVAPHQKGLNLSEPEERETELVQEIKDLRRQIQAVRGASLPQTSCIYYPTIVATKASAIVHPRRACILRTARTLQSPLGAPLVPARAPAAGSLRALRRVSDHV